MALKLFTRQEAYSDISEFGVVYYIEKFGFQISGFYGQDSQDEQDFYKRIAITARSALRFKKQSTDYREQTLPATQY